jgi:hypothetical protein
VINNSFAAIQGADVASLQGEFSQLVRRAVDTPDTRRIILSRRYRKTIIGRKYNFLNPIGLLVKTVQFFTFQMGSI